jgi:hypothetical protein
LFGWPGSQERDFSGSYQGRYSLISDLAGTVAFCSGKLGPVTVSSASVSPPFATATAKSKSGFTALSRMVG